MVDICILCCSYLYNKILETSNLSRKGIVLELSLTGDRQPYGEGGMHTRAARHTHSHERGGWAVEM